MNRESQDWRREVKMHWSLLFAVTCFWFLVAASFGQPGLGYDALVQQGNSQLQAGSNDLALATANSAIKMNSNRWEAYALVGGALMNLKRYEEAADQFGRGIERAPESKQAGLRDLRKQCLLAEAGASPNPAANRTPAATPPSAEATDSGPSYDETVRYIQDRIRDAGYTTPTIQVAGLIGGKEGIGYTVTFDDAKYTFSADGCESMTFTDTVTAHMDDSDDERPWNHKEGQQVHSYTVPFKSVASISNISPQVAAIYSTHEITKTVLGGLMGDGHYLSNNWPDVMIEQLPPTFAFGSDHQDWHDAVWIVPKDLNVSWTNFDNIIDNPHATGGGPENQSGNVKVSGLPILMIRFVKPGIGAESTHVAKAIQHLVELCAAHPEQAPKDPF